MWERWNLAISLAVRLAFDELGHTFKIGHISPHIRIQCVYNHLAIGWTCDLHPSVHQAGCGGSTLPCVIFSDVFGLREEVEEIALVELRLPDFPAFKEGFPGSIEGAMEEGEEDGGVLGEDLASLVVQRSKDRDILEDSISVGSHDVECGDFK